MATVLSKQTDRHAIAPGRERYLATNKNLMMVVIDLNDGPGEEPDPPHQHSHEQITYVEGG